MPEETDDTANLDDIEWESHPDYREVAEISYPEEDGNFEGGWRLVAIRNHYRWAHLNIDVEQSGEFEAPNDLDAFWEFIESLDPYAFPEYFSADAVDGADPAVVRRLAARFDRLPESGYMTVNRDGWTFEDGAWRPNASEAT